MINSTWLIFGGLGITAIASLVLSATSNTTSSSISTLDSSSDYNYVQMPDYQENQYSSNVKQPSPEYDDLRTVMQAYGGKRIKKKTRRSKRPKKSSKRVKK